MNYIEYLESQADMWIENQIKSGGLNAKSNNKKASKSNLGDISNDNNMVHNKHS